MKPTIAGIQQARLALLRLYNAAETSGPLDQMLKAIISEADREASPITPVDTGTWRASHEPRFQPLEAELRIDPDNVNPKYGGRPADYGLDLAQRKGGRYDVYGRVVSKEEQIVARGRAVFWDAL